MLDDLSLSNEGGVVPELMAHDVAATATFWRGLGFDVDETAGLTGSAGLTVRHDDAAIRYVAVPAMDIRTTQCVAFVKTSDVDALHGGIAATGIWQLGSAATDDRDDGFAQRLAAGASIARLGAPADRTWGMREFRLFDPSNNLIRFAQDTVEGGRAPG